MPALKIKKFKQISPKPDDKKGWCVWQYPAVPSYWLECCDCGLTHEFQFRISAGDIIRFRCRRAKRYTKRARAIRKQHADHSKI